MEKTTNIRYHQKKLYFFAIKINLFLHVIYIIVAIIKNIIDNLHKDDGINKSLATNVIKI